MRTTTPSPMLQNPGVDCVSRIPLVEAVNVKSETRSLRLAVLNLAPPLRSSHDPKNLTTGAAFQAS